MDLYSKQYLYKGDSNNNNKNNIKLDLKSNLINTILMPELKTKAKKIIICDADCIIDNSMKKLINEVFKENKIKAPEIIMKKNGIEC